MKMDAVVASKQKLKQNQKHETRGMKSLLYIVSQDSTCLGAPVVALRILKQKWGAEVRSHWNGNRNMIAFPISMEDIMSLIRYVAIEIWYHMMMGLHNNLPLGDTEALGYLENYFSGFLEFHFGWQWHKMKGEDTYGKCYITYIDLIYIVCIVSCYKLLQFSPFSLQCSF